jgi:PP-loop superfamily ATP-utilizing enzyme
LNRNEWQEAPVLLRDEGEAIIQLQTLLKDAIYRQTQQLPSESVGVFLSGGIDSSTVAALLVQAGVKMRAYALDFEPILGNNRFNQFSPSPSLPLSPSIVKLNLKLRSFVCLRACGGYFSKTDSFG